ncbi:MAG: family 20 glycosylhydrolase, partial [Phycisphaerae bacterium]
EGWSEFCRQQVACRGIWPEGTGESPYRTTRNSLHVELAGGDWLSQDEVRDLIAFAGSRGLEVIPEVQSLSHSYWLLQRHRELAEYPLARFPFTYCPSNPRTYELLFDCLEEVIEVFRPRWVHIGHDEIYELAQCSRCRRRRGADLLVEDICRIHAFLKKRRIGVMMWGDSLVKKHNGLEKRRLDLWNKYHRDTVSTYQAIERLPRDIAILNWSWSLDRQAKAYFISQGFGHLYGNLQPLRIGDWPADRSDPLDLGGEVSTWTGLSEQELGLDGLFERIILAGQVLWGPWQHEQLPLHERAAGQRVARLKRIFADQQDSRPAVRYRPLALPRRGRVDLGYDLPYGPANACGAVRFEPDFARPVRLGAGQRVQIASGLRASGLYVLAACQEPETYRTTADTYGQPVSLELGRVVIDFGHGQGIEEVLRYGVHLSHLWSHPLFGGPWCYRAEPAYRSPRSVLYAAVLNWGARRAVRRISLHGTRQPLDNALLVFGLTAAV